MLYTHPHKKLKELKLLTQFFEAICN
jgi:hypothetical protein